MKKLIFLVSLIAIFGSNLFGRSDHYDVYMKPGNSHTITFKSWHAVKSHDEEGVEVMRDSPHLWRLIDSFNKEVVRLNDEKDKDGKNIYDLGGKWKVSAGNALAAMALMPCLIGLFIFGPYEQEYVFDAVGVGITRLTFLCERRYRTNVVTKKVTIDFHVNQDGGYTDSLYVA